MNGLYCATHRRIAAVTLFADLYGQAAVPAAEQNILQHVTSNCKLLSKIELHVDIQTKIVVIPSSHTSTIIIIQLNNNENKIVKCDKTKTAVNVIKIG